MRVRNLHVGRVRGEDHILELNSMLWQGVHKIDMELAQEERVVFEYHHNYAQRSLIELL